MHITFKFTQSRCELFLSNLTRVVMTLNVKANISPLYTSKKINCKQRVTHINNRFAQQGVA